MCSSSLLQTARFACFGSGTSPYREVASIPLTFLQHMQLQVAGAPVWVLANLARAAPTHLAGAPTATVQPARLQVPPWELSIFTLSLQQKSDVKCTAMQPARLWVPPGQLTHDKFTNLVPHDFRWTPCGWAACFAKDTAACQTPSLLPGLFLQQLSRYRQWGHGARQTSGFLLEAQPTHSHLNALSPTDCAASQLALGMPKGFWPAPQKRPCKRHLCLHQGDEDIGSAIFTNAPAGQPHVPTCLRLHSLWASTGFSATTSDR